MSSDPYMDVIGERWSNIATLYNRFRDRDQVIELDIVEQRIYSYPAADYIQNLSERTRDQTAREFAEATKSNRFLLFVRDSKNQRLRSHLLDVPRSHVGQLDDNAP